MKKIKLPATVKDIERNYKNLSLDKFVVSLFDLEMDYWLYVELKNQFITLYGDQCTSNNTYQIICTLCEEHRKSEFDNFKKRIESDIESYSSYGEKIEFLNKELNNIKSEWEKLVPEIYRSLNLINTYLPLGLDRKPQEPIIFYKQASEYLTAYINKLEKDDLIERTPIINDLRSSLGNFTFTEWTIKAEREAPKNLNERLTYFVSIRSDIQRWENNNQNGKKINFFDVIRYTSYDERGNAYGPMSNLLSFIEWCTLQIDLIKLNPSINKIKTPLNKMKEISLELGKDKEIFILKLLEDLAITVNGKYALSYKRKGAIRGVVEALKLKQILPERSIESLNNLIAKRIGLIIKSKLDSSDVSDRYKKLAIKYISENHIK